MAEDKDKKGMIVFTKFSPYTVVDTKIENYWITVNKVDKK